MKPVVALAMLTMFKQKVFRTICSEETKYYSQCQKCEHTVQTYIFSICLWVCVCVLPCNTRAAAPYWQQAALPTVAGRA